MLAIVPPQLPPMRERCLSVAAPFLPGAAQAFTNVAVGYPFDTLKTQLQLQMHRSLAGCLRAVWSNRLGLVTLYRGAAVPLVSLVVKRPFEFAVFELFNSNKRSSAPFLGGCLAGVTAAILGCPFSVVKIQMQSTAKSVHSTSSKAAFKVWKSAGAMGFYRGLKASVIMQVPFATMYLGLYGNLREELPKTTWGPALAGGVASLATWSLLQPLDTLRTVTQAGVLRHEPAGWTHHLKIIVHERGVLGLWNGWVPVALRAFPTSALSMFVYEKVRAECNDFDAAR